MKCFFFLNTFIINKKNIPEKYNKYWVLTPSSTCDKIKIGEKKVKTNNYIKKIEGNFKRVEAEKKEIGNGCFVVMMENMLQEDNAMIGIEDKNFNLLTPIKFKPNLYVFGDFVVLKGNESCVENGITIHKDCWTIFNTKTKSFVSDCKFNHVEASPDICVIDFYEGVNSYTLNIVDGSFVFNNTISRYMLDILERRPLNGKTAFSELDYRYFMENNDLSVFSEHKTKVLKASAEIGCSKIEDKNEREKMLKIIENKVNQVKNTSKSM